MNKILTFIIPSYNVEQYLDKCLGSFLDPNILDFLEVIVVDDGSTDHTASIARGYVMRYPQVYRLIQKENGGHGSTINVGSREATGKYIKVIDADDWVVTNNLNAFVDALRASDADVVLNPFHMVDMKTGAREARCMYLSDYSRTYPLNDIMVNWKSFDRCLTFHGITYNRSFYNRFRHELPEKIFYEDQEYASIPCCHAQKIQVMNLALYQYLVGNGEQSVAAHNQLKRIHHIRQVALNMLSYSVNASNLSPSQRNYLEKKTEGVLLSFYTIANLVNPDRKEGRACSKRLNKEVRRLAPAFYQRIKRKYYLYYMFNLLGINIQMYECILKSNIYNRLRGNRSREIV